MRPGRCVTAPLVSGFALSLLLLGTAGLSSAADKSPTDATIKEVTKAAKKARIDTDFRPLVEELLKATEEAVADDNFADATRAIGLAVDLAPKAGSKLLMHRTKEKADQVKILSREFKQLSGKLRRLAEDENDAAANQAVGLFRCLGQGQWGIGAPMLEKSGVEPFVSLGRAELAPPKAEEDRLAFAKLWETAPIDNEWLKQAALRRAYHWYATVYRETADGADRDKLRATLGKLPIMYLTDMREEQVGEGPWGFGKYGAKGSTNSDRITVDGTIYNLGLGVHPNDGKDFKVRYKLNGQYRTLSGGCALCDLQVGFGETLTFSVVGDGRQLWASQPLSNRKDAEFFTINVKGVQSLEIICKAPGSANNSHTA